MSDDPPPTLPYASPYLTPRKTHSMLGIASAAWPLLILAYCGNVFGKAGAILLFVGPIILAAAIIEGTIRRKRLLIPLSSFVVGMALIGFVVFLLLRQ